MALYNSIVRGHAAATVPCPFSWRLSGVPCTTTASTTFKIESLSCFSFSFASFCSRAQTSLNSSDKNTTQDSSKHGPLKPGLYLVGTPIGNLEDITLRALRVLKTADVILSEDTRHSGKLLHHYNIKTPLLSYHKFNESQREQTVLKRLQQGDAVALISDAGTPGISDPGMELAMLCVDKSIPVVPIPGPSALITALSASGLLSNEFTFGRILLNNILFCSVQLLRIFERHMGWIMAPNVMCDAIVGFLPKHNGSRRERLMISANEGAVQIFYVPPHKLYQFLEEASSIFCSSRQCVIARELTKIHEEFWRGTLGQAKDAYSTHQPKGEITLMIEGKKHSAVEIPESQLENELRDLISNGHSLSMAVKLVAAGSSSVSRKTVYSLALRKFGKQLETQDDLD